MVARITHVVKYCINSYCFNSYCINSFAVKCMYGTVAMARLHRQNTKVEIIKSMTLISQNRMGDLVSA